MHRKTVQQMVTQGLRYALATNKTLLSLQMCYRCQDKVTGPGNEDFIDEYLYRNGKERARKNMVFMKIASDRANQASFLKDAICDLTTLVREFYDVSYC